MLLVLMAAAGGNNDASVKMMAFIEGGAEGNELSEGLRTRLLAVAGTVSVDYIPPPVNKSLTGRAFRRCADKMEGLTKDDLDFIADWLSEEYPEAAASFVKPSRVVDFHPPGGNKALGTSAMSSVAPAVALDTTQQSSDAMNECALKQMLPDGSTCAALSFAMYAGRLPSAVDGNGLAFGSEVRLSGEYKVLCKVGIDNLKSAIDKGTNRALDAYFDELMQQMQDTGQPSMQSRIAVWYHSTRTAFPEVESRIEYIEAYLNKHQGKGLPEIIDHQLIMRFKVMRESVRVEQTRHRDRFHMGGGDQESEGGGSEADSDAEQ